jgi:hypothetical protein
MRLTRNLLAVAGMYCLFSTLGCGGKDYSIAPVSGVVTLNGKPVSNAKVQFLPAEKGNPGPPSSSIMNTDDDGHFELQFADQTKGAVVGKCHVLVSTRRTLSNPNDPDTTAEITPELFPDAYKTNPFVFEVPRGGTQNAKIDLIGPPPGAPGSNPFPIGT